MPSVVSRMLLSYELRRNSDGTLDEVVLFGCNVHLEQMSDDQWWLGQYKNGRCLHVWFTAKSHRQLEAGITEDGIGLPVVVPEGRVLEEEP